MSYSALIESQRHGLRSSGSVWLVKGGTNMKEVPAKEPSPFESWSMLIEKTMSGYPSMQTITSPAQEGSIDPWTVLINRLWEANPYSSVLPIDPGEILSIFQNIWLDALTNPTRLWALYNEWVQ